MRGEGKRTNELGGQNEGKMRGNEYRKKETFR